jgi:shikimate dehydrogenase
MIISGEARIAGVVGWPVGHSKSPRLHNFWLERYAIDGAYVPLAVAPDDFEAALRGLKALGFAGVNVTVPHKQAALAAADEVDEAARRIGAVNVLEIGPGGALMGSNSDGYGFLENLRAGADGFDAASGPAVVIGAGGAARAVCVALCDAGAPEIRIVNRTGPRAEALAGELDGVGTAVRWAERAAALDGAALVVNATSLGMAGQPPLDLDLDALAGDAVVNDIVYAPLTTPLLARAAARGNRVVDGLGMLIHQARPAFAAWFGRDPEVTDAVRAYLVADAGPAAPGRAGGIDADGG